jgi:uncharacterized repeat protein (TIGR01451 family)
MILKSLVGRRIRPVTPRRRPVLRASVEALESRLMPTGSVPSGVYTEDFALNSDPTRPGFDVGGAFTEEFQYVGVDNKGVFRSVDETITDPTQVMGTLRGGWVLQTDPNDSSIFQLELQNGSLYLVNFPNLLPGVHVAGVWLDVDSRDAKLTILGQHGGDDVLVQSEQKQHIFMGEDHVGPTGIEVGPIQRILVSAQPLGGTLPEVHIENLKVLVVPDGAPNSPPVAGDDSASVVPGRSVTIPVLDNDQDPDGDPIQLVAIKTQPAHGTASTASGQITYAADRSFHGTDTFTYLVEDSRGGAATGTVTVAVNTPPIAPDLSFQVPHGTAGSFSVAAPGLLAKASDPDGDPLTLTVTNGARGVVTLDGKAGGFTYFRDGGGLVIADHFTYTVGDGVDAATGDVSLLPVNQPPPAAADVTEPVAHGAFGPLTFAAPGLLVGNPSTDADGDPLRPVLVIDDSHKQPTAGRVTLNNDGSFTYTPNDPAVPDQNDSFTYALTDGYDIGPTATVHLVVANHPPVAHGFDLQLAHSQLGEPVPLGNVNNFATDADGDHLSLLASSVGGGEVTSDAQGNLTFIPGPGQTYTPDPGNGLVHIPISLAVTDGYATSTIVVDLRYPNSPPVAHDLQVEVDGVGASVPETVVKSFDVQAMNGLTPSGRTSGFVDQDGDLVHAVEVRGPLIGSMNFQDGLVFYHASPPYRSDTFTYKLSDGYEDSNVATVTLVPHRAAPILYPDALVVALGGSGGITRDILSNDLFPDGTSLAGRASIILDQTDGSIELRYQAGNDLGPPLKHGDVLDFHRNLTLHDLTGGHAQTASFLYTVRYNLNDDSNPPTELATDVTTVFIRYASGDESDNDGIPDAEEEAAPNNGDANQDHIQDSHQDNVASLPDRAADNGFVTLVSPDGTEFDDVRTTGNPSPRDTPPGVTFPLGFLSFNLIGPFLEVVNGVVHIQNSASIDLYSPVALPAPPDFHYYRYGKTPDNHADHWYDFAFDGQTGAEWLSPHQVRLHFIDGGRGDDELGMSDGMIEDVGGPAIRAPDLALSQVATPSALVLGQDLTFVLTVTNLGSSAAPGVVVTDPLPRGGMFLSASSSRGSCLFDGSAVSCSVGTIPPGASATILVTVRPTAPGTLVNIASVSGSLLDPQVSDDVAVAAAVVVPAGPLQRFVTTLYAEVLNRSPESRGLDFWVGRLVAGEHRRDVARAIFHSKEHRALVRQHLAPRISLRRAFRDGLLSYRDPPPSGPTGRGKRLVLAEATHAARGLPTD